MSYLVAVPSRDGIMDVIITKSIDAAAGFAQLPISCVKGEYSVAHNRNQAVDTMYKDGHDGLIFVDDDVTVPLDAFAKMIAAKQDIICGCVPHLKYLGPKDGLRGQVPYIMVGATEGFLGPWQWWRHWPPAGVHETHTCTTACTLISKAAFDAVGGPPWFVWPRDIDYQNGMSDDTFFMKRAREAGVKLHFHGDVRCGHAKRIDVAYLIPDPGKPKIDIYASHVPALRAIGGNYEIKRVVEYGAGKFSTPLYLDRTVFPHVESVVSYEHDQEWIKGLNSTMTPDNRLRLQLCHAGSMVSVTWGAETPDLVFIDNGPDSDVSVAYKARADLLNLHAGTACTEGGGPIVVMHDIDFHILLLQAWDTADYKYKAVYRPTNGPATGVCSNYHDLTKLEGSEWLIIKTEPVATTSPASPTISPSTAPPTPCAP